MDGDHCAHKLHEQQEPLEQQELLELHEQHLPWAQENFGGAALGDLRRSKRLVITVAAIRARPGCSVSRQCGEWAPTKAGCRLISNDKVDSQAMQQPHRELVARRCAEHERILCVQDTTQFDFSRRAARGSIQGVGPLGSHHGGGQGLIQHTGLAVTREKRVLGVLDQRVRLQHRVPPGETRKQRRDRTTEAEVWEQCAQHVAELPLGSVRLVHVCDRHADVFSFFSTAETLGHGFIVRAMHDRYVHDESPDSKPGRLRDRFAREPIRGERTLWVPARSGPPKKKRKARWAKLVMRRMPVLIPPPQNDPRWKDHKLIKATAIEVREVNAPSDVAEPLHWILLTNELVLSDADAWSIVDDYTCRWVIEEWHRVLKEGCRVESSQFDHGDDIERLVMILGPVAVEMLSLRDLADDPEHADDPEALQETVDEARIAVAAHILSKPPHQLTPRQYWRAMAKLGGHLGRKNDPRPGWRCLWHGHYELELLALGYRLAKRSG